MTKRQKDDIEETAEAETLGRLTARVEKAIEVIRQLRKERDTLQGELETLRKDLGEKEAAASDAAELRERSKAIGASAIRFAAGWRLCSESSSSSTRSWTRASRRDEARRGVRCRGCAASSPVPQGRMMEFNPAVDD